MDQPQFISSNPAIDEFNRANKVAQDEQTADLTNQGKVLSNKTAALKLQTDTAEAPTRLRMLTAQADTATTGAQTAAAKAPYAGPQAAAQLEQSRAATASTIASMNNSQARLHMDAFTKSLALLDAGDVDGAKRASASVGDTLPDSVVQNSQMRAAIKNVTATAQQLYPNRPKDQMTYIHAHIGELASQAQQGQQVNPQTAPYSNAPGVPEPQVTGAVKNQGETERIIANVMAENPKLSYAEAVGVARRAPNGDTIAVRKETLALNGAKADPGFQTDPNGTLEIWRAKYGLHPLAAPPKAPVEPPAQASAYLRANPKLAPDFDAKYGAGSAQRVLGAPAAPQAQPGQ